MRDVVCIAGPTASGKSAYAIEVAKSIDGEIVNADALQVYGDLRILSARPCEDEMLGIPHHLFGHVSGDIAYSTGAWLREVVPVILDILARGKTPVLVGGTGLYFKALLVGLADIPTVPAGIQAVVDTISVEALRIEAEAVDPIATARVLGDDPQRLGRIVGVYRASGQALSDWQQQTRPIIPKRYVRRAVLLPDRVELYQRINRRFELMVSQGGLEEARAVHGQSYPARRPMLKAIGLSHLLSYLDGDCDLEKAVEIAKRDTRRLAKRQSTWFRNQCGDWPQLTTNRQKDAFAKSL